MAGFCGATDMNWEVRSTLVWKSLPDRLGEKARVQDKVRLS